MFVFLFLPYVGGAVAIYDPAQSILKYHCIASVLFDGSKKKPSAFAEDLRSRK